MIAIAIVGMLTTAFVGFLAGVVVSAGNIREQLEALREAELEEREAAAVAASNRKAFLLGEVLRRASQKPQVLQ